MKRYAIALSVLLAATPVAAQTQAEMNRGADAEWRAADAVLTREWTSTYAYMKKRDAADTSRGGGFGYAAATLASQRAWLKFRDAQCVIEAGQFAGGSLQLMVRSRCLAVLTGERSKQLAALRWVN